MMVRSISPALAVFLASSIIASTVVVAAQEVTPKKIWLPGATGSGPYDVAYAWATAFSAKYPEVDVTLTSVGSGAAQKALWGSIDCEELPVDAICAQEKTEGTLLVEETVWGLGDAPISSSVYEEQPSIQIQQFPACAGAVAIVYSKEVTGFTSDTGNQLRFTFDVLSGIFNTTIAYWDDPRIQDLNPQLTLPHQRVSKVVRQDSSGQTSIVTDALDFQVPSWPEEAVGKQPDWPLGRLAHPNELSSLTCDSPADEHGERALQVVNDNASPSTGNSTSNSTGRPYSFGADGKTGVALGMLRVPYSIGYMEVGYFHSLTEFLEQAKIGNRHVDDGDELFFTDGNPESLHATMAGLADQLSPDTLELNLAQATTPPGGYPIAGYAYWYLKKNHTAFTSCYQAWLVCKFVEWSYLDPQAAELALRNGWVVPPEAVVNKTLDRLNSVMCLNTEVNPPAVIPALSYIPPPYRTNETIDLTLVITVTVAAVIIIAIVVFVVVDRRRRNGDHVWKIKKEELQFSDPPEVVGRGKFGMVLLAEYRGTRVAVKRVIPPSTKSLKNSSKLDSVLTTSMGLVSTNSKGASVSDGNESYDGGSSSILRTSGTGLAADAAVNNKFGSGLMQKDFSSSTSRRVRKMKRDFAEEMRYLSKLRHPCVTTIMGAVMGRDPMLVMEYMDHGSLYDILHNDTFFVEGELLLPILRDISQGMRFLHSAVPQVVHGDLKSANILVDNKFRAKVADFGLSAHGHLGTGTPFWMAPEIIRGESGNTSATDVFSFGVILYEVYSRRDPYDDEKDGKEVLRMVADKKIQKRPPVPRTMPDKVKALMGDCLEDDAAKRPSFEEVDMRLKRIDAETASPTMPSLGGKNSSQISLFDIFPEHIAQALQRGQTVEPEHKECVTIFFSDIVGFTSLSAELDPRKVADMLDRLYTKFDELSNMHEIFKVETIGDSYMAVTNLVKDQPHDHAKRIAEFAVDAIAAANETLIDPDDPIKGCVNIRVGFHSGSVVADVVGTRSPRYCLFGDTVNTASRMESNSEPNRINCSRPAARLLHQQCPEMPIRSRGEIHIKGKGELRCYWVNEGSGRQVRPSILDIDIPQDEFMEFAGDHDYTMDDLHSAMLKLEPLVEGSNEFEHSCHSESHHSAFSAFSGKSGTPRRSSKTSRRATTKAQHFKTNRSSEFSAPAEEALKVTSSVTSNGGGESRSLVEPKVEAANVGEPAKTTPKEEGAIMARLFHKGQEWLRLKEEEVQWDDELSV